MLHCLRAGKAKRDKNTTETDVSVARLNKSEENYNIHVIKTKSDLDSTKTKHRNKLKSRFFFQNVSLLSSSRSVMSRLSEGKMASNILKSFPNLGMSSKRQEGAWWGDQYT